MLSVIRSRSTPLALALAIAGLALGATGCHSGPKSTSAVQEAAPPAGNRATTTPSEETLSDPENVNVLKALRQLNPDFGLSSSESKGKVERADSTLPDSLKNWVGVGLTCTQIIEDGKVFEVSGSPMAQPYKLRVEDRGRKLELKVPGPQPGIVILSTGDIMGGLTRMFMARFVPPAERSRRSPLLDFVVVPPDTGRTMSPELRLELQMIRVWQRATELQVLDRSIRFSSADGRYLVEFWRVGG